MARLLFEVGFCGAVLNAYAVGNGASLKVVGIIAIAFATVRELPIQLAARLSLLLDVAIERVLADRDAKRQRQAATDDFR